MQSVGYSHCKWILGGVIHRIVWSACSLTFILACSRDNVYDGKDSSWFNEVLIEYSKEGVTIESFANEGTVFTFVFSNGHSIGFDGKSVGVVTIGIQGFWILNGNITNTPLETPGEELIPVGNNSDCLSGIVEGYTEWTFYYGNSTRLVFVKSLFASDPDIVVRGINHRGYCIAAPENTLPAFRLSKLQGFNYAEADIHFTADGVPVLIHDATVDRTSDGKGLVKDMTWDEISRLDFGGFRSDEFAGTRIPSLEDFLDLCSDIELWPYLELKAGSYEQITQLVYMVEQSGLKDKVTYISFFPGLLYYVTKSDKTASIGLLVDTPVSESVIQTIRSLKTGSNYVFIDSSDYSETTVSLCQRVSIPLEVWTIDSRTKVCSLPQYVSGVTSNWLHAGRLLAEM